MVLNSATRPLCGCAARGRGLVEAQRSAQAGPSTSSLSGASTSSRRSFATSSARPVKAHRERNMSDPLNIRNIEKFRFDDAPTVGHALLQRQRELLKYGRIVEWELPKLEALRRPYNPPQQECILRFRSLHYQGEAHPATRKSVVTFLVADLFKTGALKSAAARRKFLLLAGVRWDPYGRDEGKKAEQVDIFNDRDGVEAKAISAGLGSVKISCERFPEERQNLKWCSDVIDKMIKEANSNSDDVASVPLDFRSSRARESKRIAFARKQAPTIADFPEEWLPKVAQ